jgi:hypothetical protein
VPASVPHIPETGFKIPEHLLDFSPSRSGEEVFEAVLGPFKRLLEENIPLIAGVAGVVVCIYVGWFVIKFVQGKSNADHVREAAALLQSKGTS